MPRSMPIAGDLDIVDRLEVLGKWCCAGAVLSLSIDVSSFARFRTFSADLIGWRALVLIGQRANAGMCACCCDPCTADPEHCRSGVPHTRHDAARTGSVSQRAYPLLPKHPACWPNTTTISTPPTGHKTCAHIIAHTAPWPMCARMSPLSLAHWCKQACQAPRTTG